MPKRKAGTYVEIDGVSRFVCTENVRDPLLFPNVSEADHSSTTRGTGTPRSSKTKEPPMLDEEYSCPEGTFDVVKMLLESPPPTKSSTPWPYHAVSTVIPQLLTDESHPKPCAPPYTIAFQLLESCCQKGGAASSLKVVFDGLKSCALELKYRVDFYTSGWKNGMELKANQPGGPAFEVVDANAAFEDWMPFWYSFLAVSVPRVCNVSSRVRHFVGCFWQGESGSKRRKTDHPFWNEEAFYGFYRDKLEGSVDFLDSRSRSGSAGTKTKYSPTPGDLRPTRGPLTYLENREARDALGELENDKSPEARERVRKIIGERRAKITPTGEPASAYAVGASLETDAAIDAAFEQHEHEEKLVDVYERIAKLYDEFLKVTIDDKLARALFALTSSPSNSQNALEDNNNVSSWCLKTLHLFLALRDSRLADKLPKSVCDEEHSDQTQKRHPLVETDKHGEMLVRLDGHVVKYLMMLFRLRHGAFLEHYPQNPKCIGVAFLGACLDQTIGFNKNCTAVTAATRPPVQVEKTNTKRKSLNHPAALTEAEMASDGDVESALGEIDAALLFYDTTIGEAMAWCEEKKREERRLEASVSLTSEDRRDVNGYLELGNWYLIEERAEANVAKKRSWPAGVKSFLENLYAHQTHAASLRAWRAEISITRPTAKALAASASERANLVGLRKTHEADPTCTTLEDFKVLNPKTPQLDSANARRIAAPKVAKAVRLKMAEQIKTAFDNCCNWKTTNNRGTVGRSGLLKMCSIAQYFGLLEKVQDADHFAGFKEGESTGQVLAIVVRAKEIALAPVKHLVDLSQRSDECWQCFVSLAMVAREICSFVSTTTPFTARDVVLKESDSLVGYDEDGWSVHSPPRKLGDLTIAPLGGESVKLSELLKAHPSKYAWCVSRYNFETPPEKTEMLFWGGEAARAYFEA